MSDEPIGIKAPAGVRPSVDDVALLIRARTKDKNGLEVGTFDDDTRPTSDQVEQIITASLPLILMRLPRIENLPPELVPAVAAVVALEAACKCEKTFWPEQVRTDRSAYSVLLAELNAALDALVVAASSGGVPSPFGDIANIPVRSWTMIDTPIGDRS